MSEADPAKRRRTVRIGGASGFWGDSAVGAPQLVEHGDVDFLVFDYLAETTMSILAGARLRNPEAGYATDFVEVAMKSVLRDVVERGIRVISNAGGVHPHACARALEALARAQGVALEVAVVEGDDALPVLDALRARDAGGASLVDVDGRPLPAKLLTANAYLGALPIRAALDAGARVVVTGRCVDSAVTLGALMHAFDWRADDYDRLAAGSLAGHLIECGCQATGGLHTDWDTVPDWPNIGYPIVEGGADGEFVVTKPPGTGGKVTPAVVAEQLLYEIGDPAAYRLPDVVCDFTQVRLDADGVDRVRVRGARGRAPDARYKISATHVDGYRSSAMLSIVGIDAHAKAQRTGEAILARTRALFARQGWPDYAATRIEVLGGESGYGPHANPALRAAREAVLRIAVRHPRREALECFAREIAPAGTSWSPGTTGASGRPSVSPSIRPLAFFAEKSLFSPAIVFRGERSVVSVPVGEAEAGAARDEASSVPPAPEGRGAHGADGVHGVHEAPLVDPGEERRAAEGGDEEAARAGSDLVEVPLVRLAWARSGDKGDTANVGVVARSPSLVPVLRAQLTARRVAAWLAHCVEGPVVRYELPGIGAFNFVCERALDGGAMTSLRNDALGKGMAQMLLSLPLRIDPRLLDAPIPGSGAAAGSRAD
ncbi:MAG TPA: acyclic terpene utilization AtuA family protein [Zeimonas sp.]|nr:acyclic terpene utilization AtuA family protein [Zeimonas sp.]